jgi:hypothetical protein
MKLCKKCNTTKEFLEFSKKKSNKDGLNNWCKECNKEYLKNYYLENKDYLNDKTKSNYQIKSEYYKLKSKEYRNENKEYYSEYHKNYYLDNKEDLLDYKKGHYLNNNSTIEMLGYSSNDLKRHMELLFLDGMSWENWGEWHIDHKIPVSKFDKETPMTIVNNLNNLQPLWALDNLSKSNKIEND